VRQIAEQARAHGEGRHVEGDDLLPRIDDLRPHLDHLDTGAPFTDSRSVTANAYLGGWGIAAALDAGADVVVCGRVTDAAVVDAAPQRGGTAGHATTGTSWPAPWWPGT
jgi:hypothetical protein